MNKPPITCSSRPGRLLLSLFVFAVSLSLSGVLERDYAVFAPRLAVAAPQTETWHSIIQRASAALDRPPAARTRLHTEGTLPGRGIYDESVKARQDQTIVLDLAMAWKITGDRRFLVATNDYLDAWIAIYRPSLNPIDESGFDAMILATDLVVADLPVGQRLKIRRFWRQMAVGYLNAMNLRPRGSDNNWQSHRVKLATMGAFATGDVFLIARARSAFQRQIERNIRRDGSVMDFHSRDALHYVTYDLEPLLMAAVSANAHGQDWFSWRSAKGTGLPQALRWLEPYARGEKRHIEFVRSTVKFDRRRAEAGVAKFKPHVWDRGGAVQLYALATLCRSDYRPLLSRLVNETGEGPKAWTVFLIANSEAK